MVVTDGHHLQQRILLQCHRHIVFTNASTNAACNSVIPTPSILRNFINHLIRCSNLNNNSKTSNTNCALPTTRCSLGHATQQTQAGKIAPADRTTVNCMINNRAASYNPPFMHKKPHPAPERTVWYWECGTTDRLRGAERRLCRLLPMADRCQFDRSGRRQRSVDRLAGGA